MTVTPKPFTTVHLYHALRPMVVAGDEHVYCDTCNDFVSARDLIATVKTSTEGEQTTMSNESRKQLETFFTGAARALVADAIADNMPGGAKANVEKVKEALLRAYDLGAAAEGKADDIRALGWAVAVHNDYRQNGEAYTFWLFTKDGRAIKGEGRTDAEALDQVRAALRVPTSFTSLLDDENLIERKRTR